MNKWQNKGTPWERLPKEVKIILALMLGFVLIFPPRLSTETYIEVCDEEIYDVTVIRADDVIRRDTITYPNRILASLKEEVKIPKIVSVLNLSTKISFRDQVKNLKDYNKQISFVKKKLNEIYGEEYKFRSHRKNLNKLLAEFLIDDILYGVPFELTSTQYLLESGGGSSYLSKKASNHFGHKYYNSSKRKYKGVLGYVERKDDEYKNGVLIPSKFIKFKSSKYSIRAHSQVVQAQHYNERMKEALTFGYYQELNQKKILELYSYSLTCGKRMNYATSKTYKKKLRRIFRDTGLQTNTIRKDLGMDLSTNYYIKHLN